MFSWIKACDKQDRQVTKYYDSFSLLARLMTHISKLAQALKTKRATRESLFLVICFQITWAFHYPLLEFQQERVQAEVLLQEPS
jgi:hypothetical protein